MIMSTQQQRDYYQRVAMATTQFLSTLDMLRNLHRQGMALDFLNPDMIPQATPEKPLTPEEEVLAAEMQQAIDAFAVFEEQGIFAEITGPQKERAQKLYKMLRTSFVLQG